MRWSIFPGMPLISSFFNDIDLILVPSCFPRQDALNNIRVDLQRSRSKFDLRSKSRGDPSRSYCIWIDASWWDKHNVTTPTSLSRLNKKLLTKRLVTSGDLIWPFQGSPMKIDIWVITGDVGQQQSGWMEMFRWVNEVVEILPIDLNCVFRWRFLTWPEGLTCYDLASKFLPKMRKRWVNSCA